MKKQPLSGEKLIAKAKEHAKAWNAFREMMIGVYSWERLLQEAQALELPYRSHMLSKLKKEGLLVSSQRSQWHFRKDTPIHYSIVIKCIEYQREIDAKRRTPEKYPKDIVDLGLPGPIKEGTFKPNLLPETIWTDEMLVTELRARGYEVKATKIIEL